MIAGLHEKDKREKQENQDRNAFQREASDLTSKANERVAFPSFPVAQSARSYGLGNLLTESKTSFPDKLDENLAPAQERENFAMGEHMAFVRRSSIFALEDFSKKFLF